MENKFPGIRPIAFLTPVLLAISYTSLIYGARQDDFSVAGNVGARAFYYEGSQIDSGASRGVTIDEGGDEILRKHKSIRFDGVELKLTSLHKSGLWHGKAYVELLFKETGGVGINEGYAGLSGPVAGIQAGIMADKLGAYTGAVYQVIDLRELYHGYSHQKPGVRLS